MNLNKPSFDSQFESLLLNRKSCRDFEKTENTNLNDLSQLLWASIGIAKKISRTYPSAGGLYPIRIYVATCKIINENESPGIFHYDSIKHILKKHIETKTPINDLAYFTPGQEWISNSNMIFIVTVDPFNTLLRYDERGWLYCYQESGIVSQNVLLQAEALNYGCCMIGAFQTENLKGWLGLSKEIPVSLIVVGKKYESNDI